MTQSSNTCIYIDDWLINHQLGALVHTKTGEQKRLGDYQLKLLGVLAQHAGTIISRDDLTSLVWDGRIVGNNSLPNAIHALRVALDDNGKHQRIIKTVSKKGYLLEKAFCRMDINEPNHLTPTTNNNEPDDAYLSLDNVESPTTQEQHISKPSAITNIEVTKSFSTTCKEFCIKRPYVYGLILLCLLTTLLSVYQYLNNHSPLNENGYILQKVESDTLKNITLYRVINAGQLDEEDDPDNLSQRLSSTFSLLDNQLEKINSKMHIYYRSFQLILSYSFIINTPCGQKELNMNIYHWRINNERLNKLIFDETMRKLNEKLDCHS